MLVDPTKADGRWALYRLLGDPARLRLLALATRAELSVSELALVLDDSQPNVSRHASALRRGGLIVERRDGTRSYLRIAPGVVADPVVRDGVSEGLRLCVEQGRLERVAEMLQRRDQQVRERTELASSAWTRTAMELPAYVMAVAAFTGRRGLVVDICTGYGAELDVLAPFFERVITLVLDTSKEPAVRERVRRRGYANVEVMGRSGDAVAIGGRIEGRADLVFADRPFERQDLANGVARLAALLVPGGELTVIDDRANCEPPSPAESAAAATDPVCDAVIRAGLGDVSIHSIPLGMTGQSADRRVPWQLIRARRSGRP